MSYGTQRVRHNGSTVTFHRNKSSDLKGYIYVAGGVHNTGRRVYGRIVQYAEGLWSFVPNAEAQAVAQPA